jgi:O-antigen ligase
VQLKVSSRNQSGQLGADFRGRRPTLFAVGLFFLLFSGPPSFRLRDPTDSLESVIDPTVVFQVSVWIVAGIWTLYQLRKEFRARSPMTLCLPDKFGLLMILFLGLSTFVSEAPLLTAFKVGQILVSLLFTWIFVHRYGIAKCIDYVFLGSTILCVAIAISAFAAPDLVLFADEGHMRLRGDPIAVMGTVGTYSTILLVIKSRQIPRVVFWPLLAMLCTLLAFSLTRHAWFLVPASLLLYFAGRSKGTLVRRLGFLFLAILPFVFSFYILPTLQEYRATDSIGTLTGRTDLWVYLVGIALLRSPWIGLGYYSASRILGTDFNPGMGTAHSIFVEVLLGGGLVSLIPCVALSFLLTRKAFQFLSKDRTDLELLCGILFMVTLTIALLGGDFSSGEIGITFWSLAAAIPAMSLGRSVPHPLVSAPICSKLSPITSTSVMPADSRSAET